jgi:hypothetical protein
VIVTIQGKTRSLPGCGQFSCIVSVKRTGLEEKASYGDNKKTSDSGWSHNNYAYIGGTKVWLKVFPTRCSISEYFGRMMKSFAFACDIFCAYIVVPTIREPLRVCKGFPAYTISFSPPSLSSEFQHSTGPFELPIQSTFFPDWLESTPSQS